MKKIVLLLMVSIFVIMATAQQTSYDTETNTFTIKDTADIKLITPTFSYVNEGYSKVAEFEINPKKSVNNFITNIKGYDSNGNLNNYKKYDYYYFYKTGTKSIDDYAIDCSSKLPNGTDVCINKKIGSHNEDIGKWIPFDNKYISKSEVTRIALFTNVWQGERIDWIPEFYGIRVNEWAYYEGARIETYPQNIDVTSSTVTNINCGQFQALRNITINQIGVESTAENCTIYVGGVGNNFGAVNYTGIINNKTRTCNITLGAVNVTKDQFVQVCLYNNTLGYTFDYHSDSNNYSFTNVKFIPSYWNGGVFGYGAMLGIKNVTSQYDIGMSVSLDYPENYHNNSYRDTTFNCSFISLFNITNVSLWTNDAGTFARRVTNDTSLLNLTELSSSFSRTIPYGSSLWACEICSNGICFLGNENRTININHFAENSQTFNTTSYETSSENFIINMTYDNTAFTGITGTLYYNGTSYSGTKIGSGSTIQFARTLDIPADYIGNNTFYWRIGFINSSGTFYYNSTTQYQNVSAMWFGQCNSTLTISYINFTFKDESNSSNIKASIPYATFEYYLGNSSVTKSFNYINLTENYNYSFCSIPSDRQMNVDVRIQYEAGGYPQRIYQPDTLALTNASTNQVLYLLSELDGLYVTFQILGGGQPLEGATITATRAVNGTQTVVGYGTAGASGTVALWLNPNYVHTILAEKEGYVSYSFNEAPTQTFYSVELTPISSTTSQVDYSLGISQYINPSGNYLNNGTTYNFNYSIISEYHDLDEFGANLYGDNTFLDAGSAYSSTGGTVTILTNTANYSRITMNFYYVINGTYVNGTTNWLIQYPNDFSIWHFFTDLVTYIDADLFGILGDDNGVFSKALISFVIIILLVGGLIMKFGVANEATIMGMIFGIVLFLNSIGMIPNPDFITRGTLGDFITAVLFILMVVLIVTEARK